MKGRRPTRWLIGIALGTMALLAIVVAFRAPLAERAGTAYLVARGFAQASVSVSQVGLHRTVVENLALGPGLPGIERIELQYRPTEVIGLRLRAVRIDGLRAIVDGKDPTALARLDRLLPSVRGGDGPAVPGPTVDMADAQITLRDAAIADITVDFHGTLDLSQSPVRASLDGQARGEFGRAALTVRADDLFERPVLRIQGDASGDLTRVPWPESRIPRPRSGTMNLTFSGNVQMPSLDGPVFTGLLEREGSLAVDLTLREVALPPYAASVDASASLAAHTGDGAFALKLAKPAVLTVRGLPEAMPQAVEKAEFSLGATQPTGGGGASPPPSRGTIRISGRLTEGRIDATLLADAVWAPATVTGPPAHFTTDLLVSGVELSAGRVRSAAWHGDGSLTSGSASQTGLFEARFDILRAGGLEMKDIEVNGTLGLSGAPGEPITATVTEGIAKISPPVVLAGLQITSPIRLAIPSARMERASNGRITLDARLLPEALKATIALADDRRTHLGASAAEIDVSLQSADPMAGQLRLRGGSLHMPPQDILAERIEATIPFPLASASEPAHLSAIVSTMSGLLVPLALDARVIVEDGAFLLNGLIALPDHDVQIPLKARFLGTEPRGNIALGPVTLAFLPTALQPAALGTMFATMTQATGEVEMSGALSVEPGAPLDGEAVFQFRDFTAATADDVIEKLNGAIRLMGLFPPRTEGEQTLSARRVMAGIPLDEPSVRFRLEPTEAGTVVVIDHAEGKIAEGKVSVDEARFSPSATTSVIKIRIDSLSLDRLLRDYAMEGLSGTGTLSGTVPVTFSSAGVAIESGAVQAEGSGVLKIAWSSARDALMQQGEQVALMAQALEDFHYSTLRITINRPPDGSLSLLVAMEGHNPTVRDGYPFRFNIALSGELEKILAAIREGGRLGTDLFRGGLGGAP